MDRRDFYLGIIAYAVVAWVYSQIAGVGDDPIFVGIPLLLLLVFLPIIILIDFAQHWFWPWVREF